MQDIKQLIIIGVGETAELAYEYFTHDSDYQVCAFAVHRQYKNSDEFLGLPLVEVEQLADLYPAGQHKVFVAMSSGELNYARARVYNEMKKKGYVCASYVSSKAFVWHNVSVGENCFILEDNTLQPFTSVGDNVVMWSGNHLGHRSVVKSHCFITSHCVISGFCEVGEYSFLGVNSCIADNVKIAKDNFIALGSVINQNTEENAIYRGNPAEISKIPAKKFCKVKE
ncbi:acetyltransferase [Campylobacter upsaliensis]|uniref:acetyltransferase n=1 Tax=Campylobacter upsaliensis TaxID=28080 RepID=UPI000E16B7B5|nr:acetyltransferase [Campylobacter upsaliensis]EAI3670906.1 acetyltransferase [Campylobacter upsaliensis]EAJ7110566.1 acetyltransferase [Campylobacter upsaliensis]EAK1468369.1 acetyltransferase [Campylobacter upsaliensis]EHB2692502.1 acetyltransferase [Campylobacter upsaliensis]EKK0586923.1 acetyltransferase [Campylobacter upsaliensis]